MVSSENQPEKKINKPGSGKVAKFFLKFTIELIIPVLIVFVAVIFFKHQMETRPKAERRKPPKQARLVAVKTVEKGTFRASVSAMGTVVPSREITIKPQVTGLIVFVDPSVIPGGLIEQGQVLYRIDTRDYLTAVKQQESNVAKAVLDMKLEYGYQQVARQEYQMLEEAINEQDTELVLRKPQMAQAQASFEAAKALLDQAKLNLERCTIPAPFNSIIIEKHEDIGAVVSPNNSLLHIIGTDEYWIEVAVPVDQLKWINIPKSNKKNGSVVRIYDPMAWGGQTYIEGQVIRLMGQLEERGRMAKLLVSVKDPLSLDKTSSHALLFIGSYVRVEIEGKELNDVVAVEREYLRNGFEVWIMNPENKLEIRPVEIEFSAKDTVYIRKGLKSGEQIVTTNISAPVENMPLRTENVIPDGKHPENSVKSDEVYENKAKAQ